MKSETFLLESKTYSKAQLLEYASKRMLEPKALVWERKIFEFILEWFNSESYINAQSSGSTGTPKQMKLPKSKMRESAKMTAQYFQLGAGSKVILLLPVDYIAGKMMLVRALVNQWDLYWADPKGDIMANLPNQDFDFTALVPLQVENTAVDAANWQSFKKCLLGGAAVSDSLLAKIKDLNTQFYESYGMTETMSHIAIKRLGESEYFEALPNVRFSIDERNCLNIEARSLLDSNLQTNDIVELKDEKCFRWLARFDNIINSGAVKLMPEQIEAKLKDVLPFDFFIAGIADDKLGEKAILIAETDKETLEKISWKKLFKERLSTYEKPKSIYFSTQFARSNSGKILRKESLEKPRKELIDYKNRK